MREKGEREKRCEEEGDEEREKIEMNPHGLSISNVRREKGEGKKRCEEEGNEERKKKIIK